MSTRHFFWIASLAIGMSACTTFRPARMDTAKACAEWRWIGITRPEAQCPEIPGWTVRPLFPQLAGVQQPKCDEERAAVDKVPRPEVIQELNRFCVYEIANPKSRLKDLPFPPAASAELVRFDQDCAALSASADEQREAEIHKLSERFFSQVGKPRAPLAINDRLGVRLAFLDTQPTGIGVPRQSGRSQHGYTLAHIARHLVCSAETSDRCAAQITTRLALPIVKFDAKSQKFTQRDTKRGGRLGTQTDLAKAIREEVDTWRRDRKLVSAPQRLVLNLSLAWDGELFGGLDEKLVAEMKAGTQAVYRVLEYAAGFDVLVLAAAGNRKNCPQETVGPLLPAAWERGGHAESSCPEQVRNAPLLYAVGGVQSQGFSIFNARPRGMPRRVAYAENAAVPSWDPEHSTAIYTGSSVAAAVVSSIAALVWDTRPELSSSDVMKLLENSGETLDLKADFWFGGSSLSGEQPPGVSRISLCAAVARACEEGGLSSCPVQTPCDRWEPEPPILTQLAANPLPACSCQPWLYPQPEDPPCPNPNCPPDDKP